MNAQQCSKKKLFGISCYHPLRNTKEAQKKIQKLEATKDKLSKTVNMRAMNMLGKAEEQYADLIRKKTTVENDKAKIQKVIEELDVKKKAELRTAWDKVNKDFGSSTLRFICQSVKY